MVFVGYGIRVNFSLLENLAGPEKVVRLNELRDYTNSGTIMDLVEKICGNEALNFDICKTDMTQTSSFRKEGCGLTYYNEFRTMEIIHTCTLGGFLGNNKAGGVVQSCATSPNLI